MVGDGPTKVASYSRQNYFNQKKAKVAGDLTDQDAAYVQRMHTQNPLKMQNAANLVMMRFEAAKLKRQVRGVLRRKNTPMCLSEREEL